MGMKKKWPGIKCFVLNSGNVSNTQIAISQFIGVGRPVFLCGVELGFPGGLRRVGDIETWNERAMKIIEAGAGGFEDKEYDEWRPIWDTWDYRFVGYKRDASGFSKEDLTKIPPTRLLKEGNNGIKTDQVSCFYKYSTLILWGMDAPDVYSCSRGLLNDVIPYLHPKDVMACQGNVEPSKRVAQEEKYSRAQEYLRHRGIYIMKGKGKHWVKKVTKSKFIKSKKRIIRWMFFTNIFKGKKKASRKQIIHGMMKAPLVKFRFKHPSWLELSFSPEERTISMLGYMGITNKHHVKGLERVKVVTRFNIGRWLKIW